MIYDQHFKQVLLFAAIGLICCFKPARLFGEGREEWFSVLEKHCFNCHDGPDGKGDTDLDEAFYGDFATQTAVWEKVARQLRARQMPPLDRKRPSESEYETLATAIEKEIDTRAKANPNPGHTSALKRLTRTEFQNAIRDLLGIEIEVSALQYDCIILNHIKHIF